MRQRYLLGALAGGLLGLFVTIAPVMAYSEAVEQWRPAVESACGSADCVDRIMWLINCESEGNPGAWHPNPNGGSDVGLLQINDATWGSIAYADGVSQIEWTAAHLGSVWWSC